MSETEAVTERSRLRTGRLALSASFVAISLMGTLLIVDYWGRRNTAVAWERAIAFAAIMAGIHTVGYRVWRRQLTSEQTTLSTGCQKETSQAWRTPTRIVLIVIGVGFLLLLNGQIFTNRLLFISCWTTSLILGLRATKTSNQTTLGRIFSLVLIQLQELLIALTTLTLPKAYRFERNFNQQVEEVQKGGNPWPTTSDGVN